MAGYNNLKYKLKAFKCNSNHQLKHIKQTKKASYLQQQQQKQKHKIFYFNVEAPKHPLMDDTYKQNVVYTYSWLLFILKQEGNSDTCYKWMNPEDIMLSEIRTNTVWFHLYEVLRVVKFIETESRRVVGWG